MKLKSPRYMQGCRSMRTRKSLPAVFAGIIAVLMVAPAQASADSLPEKVSDYVSDNTSYFVAALLVAILLLLLIVRITQRRSKDKQQKQAAQPGGDPPHDRRGPRRRPPRTVAFGMERVADGAV